MTATNQKERNLSLQCKIGTRQLHDWELEEVQAFLGRLSTHPLSVETDDAIVWLPTKDGAFFVQWNRSPMVLFGILGCPQELASLLGKQLGPRF